MAVSDTPWSKFSAADYSVEQWHRACLAHDHDGQAETKNDCKLPVREPDGTLNRAGVHAAAAALAGARGGVKLSVSQRISANKALAGYYKQLGEKPPAPKVPAFLKHDDFDLDAYLEHHGIKGQKWGIRRPRTVLQRLTGRNKAGDDGPELKSNADGSTSISGKSAKKLSAGQTTEVDGKLYVKRSDGKFDEMSSEGAKFIKSKLKDPDAMTDQELRDHMARANLLKQYDDMFNSGDANSALRIDTEKFRLEAERDKAKKARTKNRLEVTDAFLKTANQGFKAWNTLNEVTGGALNAKVASQYNVAKATKATKVKAPKAPTFTAPSTTKSTSAPVTVKAPAYQPTHKQLSPLQRFKAANTKASKNTPSLIQQQNAMFKAARKQPSLLEQLQKGGRHKGPSGSANASKAVAKN